MSHTGCAVAPSVTILLSTFDGEEWLSDLFASIFSQTHRGWTVRIRDDGSTDGTLNLVQELARSDDRVEVLVDDLGNLGPAASFMQLLRSIDPDHDDLFAFCDQDDVWLPEKLESSINALSDNPLAAIYTDAEVTDATGAVTSSSALADRGNAGTLPFGHLLINNVAIGATVLGTAALAQRAVDLADDRPVLMHDWWVAMVAGHSGHLSCLPEPTVRWRRHEGTVTGSRPHTLGGRAERRREYLAWSIDASQRLARDDPSTATAARAVRALAEMNEEQPTVRGLVRAWRRGGVRAWPLRGQLSLLCSVGVGQTNL